MCNCMFGRCVAELVGPLSYVTEVPISNRGVGYLEIGSDVLSLVHYLGFVGGGGKGV